MTFIPQVLTKDDPNNSKPQPINPGSSTLTTGYNSIIITISGITASCAVELQYSNDTTNANFSTFYMESAITGSTFVKSYPILKNYYRINFTGTATSVISRLSTQSYQSNTTNTVNTFENNTENIMNLINQENNTQNIINLINQENNTIINNSNFDESIEINNNINQNIIETFINYYNNSQQNMINNNAQNNQS